MRDLFGELQKAIDSGDVGEIERLRKIIMSGCRDESIDEGLIKSLKGKQIYKNLCGICSGEKNPSKSECIKIVSSLMTHNIIESEIQKKGVSEFPITEIYVLLGNLINGGEEVVEDAREFIKDRYGRFLL